MKKLVSYTMILFMLIMTLVLPTEAFQAYEANLTVGVSASTVKIGDTVTVTVKVPGAISGPVSLYFPTEIFDYVSASSQVSVTGGTVQMSIGKGGLVASDTVTVKLKAKTSTGNESATIKVASSGDIYDYDSLEEVTLKGASATIKVENKSTDTGNSGGTTESQKSADNSLSSLKLSSGTLSPSFKKSTTKYTATVSYDVTKVVVSAKTSNAKAVIESVTGDGNVSLKVGENTIKIVVRAENGVKATYTIIVTRKEQETTPVTPPEGDTPSSEVTPPEVNELLQWNGEQLQPVETIPTESIPADFEGTLLVVNGQQMQGLSFTKGECKALYLNNTNGAGSLYVFDEAQQTIYPFIKLVSEKGYAIVLLPDEQNAPAPEGFESCTFSIEGKGLVNAYQLETDYTAQEQGQDFYLVYCMNNAGEKGWYMYDSVEGTYQRYLEMTPSVQTGNDTTGSDVADTELESKYAALEKELNAEKKTQYIILAIAAVVIFLLLIIIIVLAVKRRKKDETPLEGNETEQVEEESIQETVVSEDVLAIKEALAIEEALAREEKDDEVEIDFYEMEVPEEEIDETEISVEVKEEINVEEEVEFHNLETAIVSALEEAQKEVEPAQEPEIKIVRKPKAMDLTSKFSSKIEEDDDDLEFIDFE